MVLLNGSLTSRRMGGISLIEFFIRFVLFTIFESPKYHMGKGNDDEAVRIVHEVARRNGKESACKHISSLSLVMANGI
jgi:hypothetical protein